MNNIFFIGDVFTNSGPANANKCVLDSLKKNFQVAVNSRSKWKRALEFLFKIAFSQRVFICSKTRLNKLAIRLARMFGKETVYLFHGLSSHETFIETGKKNPKDEDYDRFVLAHCDKLIFVSEKFKKFVETNYLTRNGYFHVFNSVLPVVSAEQAKKSIDVLSVGGGMKRKNNYSVAKAIAEMNQPLRYSIVGKSSSDGEAIQKFAFVEWEEFLPHEKMLEKMGKTKLYVQNSIFEPFGLSVIEALFSGCSVLISNQAGCLDLFSTATSDDIIYDGFNLEELQTKITNLLEHPNCHRLLSGFDKEKVSIEWQSQQLKEILEK